MKVTLDYELENKEFCYGCVFHSHIFNPCGKSFNPDKVPTEFVNDNVVNKIKYNYVRPKQCLERFGE